MAKHPSSSPPSSLVAGRPPSSPNDPGADFLASLSVHERSSRALRTVRATGTGNLNLTVGPSSPATKSLKLVYIRIHFSGGAGTATVTLSVDHASGSAYDTILATIAARGSTGSADCFYPVPAADNQDPSPYLVPAGSAFLVSWTNPDPGNMTYGAEVGYLEY